MKVMIALENVVMDGVKRASTVLGNALSTHYELVYYSLADAPTYFELDAPLLIANPPADPTLLNFKGAQPYQQYAAQIKDLIHTVIKMNIDTIILPAGLLTSFAPLIRAATPSVNLIGWMHNNYQTYVDDYYGYMRQEFRAGLRAVDTLVTLTEPDFKAYSQFNPNTVKIYNPLTLTPNAPAVGASKTIAFTGRIAIEHKGIDLLLSAARKLRPGWQIVMAGNSTAEDMDVFNKLMDFWELQDKVIFRGPLKDDALRDHYSSASIFVSTSRWEGMPLVIGEAMASGLPIVAMRNTGSAEFLQENKYGMLTRPADVEDFISHLNLMIDNKTMRRYFAKRSLERARDFQIDAIVAQWLPIIERREPMPIEELERA